MDEEEQQQSDSKISVSSFFERVDSVDKVANRALSKANANFDILNNQKILINSINVSIEALETKVRDIANYIIIEKKIEKDAEEDRLFEQQDESQKGSMLERLAGLKSNNESEQTQAAGEEPKKGGGGILGTLLSLGIGAFAVKFLWPAILPLAGGLIKGSLAKFATFSIGGIGGLLKGLIINTLGGIGLFNIGKNFTDLANSIGDRFDKMKNSVGNFIKNISFKKDGKVDGPDSLNVEGGTEGGTGGGTEKEMSNLGPDYKKQEEDAFKAAEDFKVEKSNLNLEENSAVNDMDKTLEKKDLKEKKDIGKTYTKEQVTEMVKEYKILVEKDKTGEPLTEEEEFERDRLKITLDKIGIETRSGKIEGTVEEFNETIRDYNESVGNTTKEAPKYGDVGGLIEVESNIENKDLDLSLSESFSEKLQPLSNQIDTLNEFTTGSTNTFEETQLVARPVNNPNTTVTFLKSTSSNTPFTNMMKNNYLSLNKTQKAELLRYIK